MKTGAVSTLDIVDEIKNRILPTTRAAAPPGLNIKELFDQSVFVRGAVEGVVREAIIAAFLTGLMILLFLGSWRSTLIIAVSIPLSILSSLAVLSFLGHTMNTMTLGGLALAIGILVANIVPRAGEVGDALDRVGFGRFLLVVLLGSAGMITRTAAWQVAIDAAGGRVRAHEAHPASGASYVVRRWRT